MLILDYDAARQASARAERRALDLGFSEAQAGAAGARAYGRALNAMRAAARTKPKPKKRPAPNHLTEAQLRRKIKAQKRQIAAIKAELAAEAPERLGLPRAEKAELDRRFGLVTVDTTQVHRTGNKLVLGGPPPAPAPSQKAQKAELDRRMGLTKTKKSGPRIEGNKLILG